jgi:hypothetical protein
MLQLSHEWLPTQQEGLKLLFVHQIQDIIYFGKEADLEGGSDFFCGLAGKSQEAMQMCSRILFQKRGR